MRLLGAALLAALACVCARSSAQQLAITGHVVSADGAPLTSAFVSLDSLKLIARVQAGGDYTLTVPGSVARGQHEQLNAWAQEHLLSKAPVVLAGTALVHDFALQVDTMPEHRRRFPRLSDGRTEKSATDVTISGQVSDTSGRPLPGVTVDLEGSGFKAETDLSGHYALVIPARIGRAVGIFLVREMGYLASRDSTVLAGGNEQRNFVLSKQIYSATATPLDSQVLRAAGLVDLRDETHRKGQREIRIRVNIGIARSDLLYRFVNRSGRVSGEVIEYIPTRDGDEPAGDTADTLRARRKCTGTTHEIFPCRARFTHEPEWAKHWRTLDSLDIWNIVDEGSLHARRSMVLDGSSIEAEMWDGQAYRAWAYTAGVEEHEPGRAKVTLISAMLREIDALVRP